MAGKPHLVVVATGGTIANTPGGRVSIEEVVSDIEDRDPEVRIHDSCELEVVEVVREGAEDFDPSTWVHIRDAVQAASDREDVDGVVVTHGTYTVEETSYYLHLTVDTSKPLVVTCSQRKHRTIGNDGDHNLRDALRAAADPQLVDEGVVLVANEEVHSAREVVKTSRRPDGFKSPSLGPLGFIEPDRVTLYRSQRRRHTRGSAFSRQSESELPHVAVISTYPGATSEAVEAVSRGSAQGVVLSGYTYAGKPAPGQVESLRDIAASGMPVVYTSRGREGRIPMPDEEDPFVRGDNLITSKAHVLATTAIAAGMREPSTLQKIFDEH